MLRPVDPKGWEFVIKHVRSIVLFACSRWWPLSPVLLRGGDRSVQQSRRGPIMFRQRRVGRMGASSTS